MGHWAFCLEEPVDGHVVYNVVFRYDKEGNYKGGHFNIKGGKLVGCNTGTVYKVMNSSNDVYNFNANNEQQVINYTEKKMYISKKGLKYIITWKGRIIINANGEAKLDYFVEDCCD